MALSLFGGRGREQAGNGDFFLGLIVAVLLDYHNNRVASSCKVLSTTMTPSTSSTTKATRLEVPCWFHFVVRGTPQLKGEACNPRKTPSSKRPIEEMQRGHITVHQELVCGEAKVDIKVVSVYGTISV